MSLNITHNASHVDPRTKQVQTFKNLAAIQQQSSYYTKNFFSQQFVHYNAPFFITWFSTNWTILYFPIYFIGQSVRMKCSGPSELVAESLKGFRDKGLTGGRFLIRCGLFCGLWVATNYMYIHSLRILLATDVMTLYATNVACVYLLSWVILHEQFVGVRVSLKIIILKNYGRVESCKENFFRLSQLFCATRE